MDAGRSARLAVRGRLRLSVSVADPVTSRYPVPPLSGPVLDLPPRTAAPQTAGRTAAPVNAPDSRRARVVDAACVCLTLLVGLWLWFANRGIDAAWRPADAPPWARARDHLLEGPDAGAWASNATALFAGRLDDLDPHRLPTLPALTALAMNVTQEDPALAGHLVNHLCHLLVGPVVYLLGRRWMSQGMALAAAVATVLYPPGVHSADRYGVDPLVLLALPAALLFAEVGAWRWWLAPLAGAAVAVAGTTHLTTIGIPVVAVLLCLFRGEAGWRRWLGALGLLGGIALTVGGTFAWYPLLPWHLFTGSLAEGVAPVGGTGGAPGPTASIPQAIEVVRTGGQQALDETVSWITANTRPRWLPWGAALALPWLGMLGFGLLPAPVPRGWFTRQVGHRLRWLRGLGVGLPLAASLVPVMAFAAANSPGRYTDNFFALGALLVFRGADVVVRAAERLLHLGWSRWPLGLLPFPIGAALVFGHVDTARMRIPMSLPANPTDVAAWRLGALLRAHFPAGGGAACTHREAIAYAGRMYCPYSNGVAFSRAAEPHRAHLSAECSGEDDIPYVITEPSPGGVSEARLRMDAWVQAQGEPVAELDAGVMRARIYAIPRTAP